MVILGLTGSIGMGKSTTAAMFRDAGIPVYDADAAVHRLYAGAAAPLIEQAFPGVVRDGAVDRSLLGPMVIGKPEAMQRLEAIVHPLVRQEEQAFLVQATQSRAMLAVLDIPLLLETGGEARVDAVVVVSASAAIQRQRVMARPGMTQERFMALLAKQMPDSEKRRRAHFIVDTGQGLPHARRQVHDIIKTLAGVSVPNRNP
jgi:dephospho-CoA kinase